MEADSFCFTQNLFKAIACQGAIFLINRTEQEKIVIPLENRLFWVYSREDAIALTTCFSVFD
jgi:hypothetical protein